jgi:hypothetical protein
LGGRNEERPEELESESVRGYGKVRGQQETKGSTEGVPGEKRKFEPADMQPEGTVVAEKRGLGNTDLCNDFQTGEEEVIEQAMQPGGASEGHVSGASKIQNEDSYGEGSGAGNLSEVDGLPSGEELFEDVLEGFEAEPERTGTTEWSETISDGTDGFRSSIGLGSSSRKAEPEAAQTQAEGEVKTGDQSVEMSGALTSGLGPLTESEIRSEFGQTESDAPLEFELSMEHLQSTPLRPLRIEQHS